MGLEIVSSSRGGKRNIGRKESHQNGSKKGVEAKFSPVLCAFSLAGGPLFSHH
jgi:hypothetical protein